jgi:hypothetical protein
LYNYYLKMLFFCHSEGNFVRAGTNKDTYAIGIPSGQYDMQSVIKSIPKVVC